jgi:hypothetical protein
VRRWSGRAEAPRGGSYGLTAREDGVSTLRSAKTAVLIADERGRLTGVVVAIDPNRGRVIGVSQPRRWESVEVRVLQDETARRALLIPVDGANAARLLSTDRFRLQFEMTRARWETTDPPDADNRYQSSATVTLNVA